MNKYELLVYFANANNITLLKDYKNEVIVHNTKICLQCPECKKETLKCYSYMLKTGVALCKICITMKSLVKQRETTMNKYGVYHISQHKETRAKIKEGFLQKYGVNNPSMTNAVKEKQKQTNLQKYGVPYVVLNSDVKQKMINTNKEKYGVECCLSNKEIKEKVNNTCLQKFGCTNVGQNSEIQSKMKNTMLKKYGVEYPLQNTNIMNKTKVTNINKYGTHNVSQNPIISEKQAMSCYKMKTYIMPSGNTILYQGYENYAINDLINDNISEENIITSRSCVPEIYYYDKLNKKRRYFVDIYIPSLNKCIEVKSEYTMKLNPENIFNKMKSTLDKGYGFEIWVYNNKGERIKCITEVSENYSSDIIHLPPDTTSLGSSVCS
jgi:hypothetical protein